MMQKSILINKRGILDECASASPAVAYLPFYYQVRLNLPCNQKCIMCAPEGKHHKDFLAFEDFTRLFEQIRGVAEHITLIGGETLMYPRIEEVLELLSRHEIAVTINTNATMLTPKITPRLLALHELDLRCSIDAATRPTYHRVRGTDVFDRVTANLRRFSAEIEANPRVRMILNYVVMRQNLEEVVPFIDFARTLTIDRVEFQPVRHVVAWQVSNGTGWRFDGREQSCEFFRDEYNAVMRQAAAKCETEGVKCEVTLL
jgi:MoaA/NifB/PqqE/SkfB family radical SAM enzyme